ncbi:RagB/SusD family nutrient uptake outer membrane protein [Chryseobacterium oryzae]|uniref:RagB/SusD family nutrient uptake outer membrane protein n=1 Tax=Chryseobacterium oryzae TaxID=2929799 RepID=A0ABY4BH21_9FLAO|nr:RagB/SusD family nutrient uptake outer membrane protein [Chryseobacterium oryzae]UOE38370.1 RagB/SusD family nutrient uptake outer membrane protein [Chryseobacterium oryzae]
MKKFFLLLSFFALLTSCKDAIDITQDAEINDIPTRFQNVEDMQRFINGAVYPAFNPLNEIYFTSIFTDEVGFGPSSVSTDDILTHRFVLNSANGSVAGIWTHNYNIINKVNILIKGSTYVNFNSLSTGDKNLYLNILAQAKAMRALAYTTLESYFSTDMKDPNALGVILSTEPADIFGPKLPRVANSSIFQLIESDLTYALANANTTTVNTGSVPVQNSLSKGAINAIAARYYNYREDDNKARTYATAAITTSGLSLSSASVYPTIWADTARGEIIWSLYRPNSTTGSWSNIASLWTTNTTDLDGSVNWDMGRKLYNLFGNSDVRKTAFVDATSIFEYPSSFDPRNRDVIVINKYPGKTNAASAALLLRNDIKMFRVSEMALILAEVAARQNDFATAANYISAIQGARNNDPSITVTYTTAQQAFRGILTERRLELCFEGHRYVDIKRLGGTNRANIGVDRDAYDDTDTTMPLTLPASDYRFTLPIPLNELNSNPVTQNPGYN